MGAEAVAAGDASTAALLAAAAARSAAFLAFLPTGPPLLPDDFRARKREGNMHESLLAGGAAGGAAGRGSGCQQSPPATAAKTPTRQKQQGGRAHAGRVNCSCDSWGRKKLEISTQNAAGRQWQLVGAGAPSRRRRCGGQPNSSMRISSPGPPARHPRCWRTPGRMQGGWQRACCKLCGRQHRAGRPVRAAAALRLAAGL
jgi:hypothetical protein